MSTYTILGFSEVTKENVDKFVTEVIKRGPEELNEIPQTDLIQIINTFNTFSQSYIQF